MPRLIRRLALFWTLAAGLGAELLWAPPTSAMAIGEARSHVEAVFQDLQSTLIRGDLSRGQREAAFGALVEQNFALDLVTGYVLGGGGKAHSDQERARFQQVYAAYLVQTLSSRISNVALDSAQVTDATPIGPQDVLVTMLVQAAFGARRKLDWRLRQIDSGYRIVDLLIDGISMTTIQRHEFGTVIRGRGLDGLIAILGATTQRLMAATQ